MERLYRKLMILKDSLIGYKKKFVIDISGPRINFEKKDTVIPIEVSLTSYGRRVESVVYYTLVSILKQTVRPQRIVLWLDDSWSFERLPSKLQGLQKYGVEFNFCKDIKSYKKLIPSLNTSADLPIVTIDDDVMYEPKFLESLYKSYLEDPLKIHCTHALKPILKDINHFDTYVKWQDYDNNLQSGYVFPIGEGGILYPPNSLHKDVTNIDLAMSLCPNADDIWFWIMALKNGTKHKVVNLKKTFYSFDALYQYFHKGSALTHSNAKENKNDIQLKNIIAYYDLKFEENN